MLGSKTFTFQHKGEYYRAAVRVAQDADGVDGISLVYSHYNQELQQWEATPDENGELSRAAITQFLL